MAAKIFRINYKSDFILTLNSDAGWLTPFCIKFWTGAPNQAYFAGWDGETYTHCAYDPSDPTKLVVQFDDHHLPIGDLKFQIAYHFTVADFPNDTEDEVLNQASVIIEVDDEPAQVMLDLNGETAPEIEFSLPAFANEAQRISNEEQRIAHEAIRIVNEESRIAAEAIRQQNETQRINNEAQRIRNEEARIAEFAQMKANVTEATSAANSAAALANEKAQLAADNAALATDKAALAQSAATLATEKAQLAADKAALAASAAQLADEKAALAQQKATYAEQQGDYAKAQGDYAKAQGDYAKAQADLIPVDVTRTQTDATFVNSDHESLFYLRQATSSLAGLMTAAEHTKLGALPTAQDLNTRIEGIIYDVSANNPTAGPNNDGKFTLAYILNPNNVNTLIPTAVRKGGMSIKFVQTSDNKYVQYRLMHTLDNVSTAAADFVNTANWQGVDDDPTVGSENLVKSGGVYKSINNAVNDYTQIIDLSYNQTAQNSGYKECYLQANKTYRITVTVNWTNNTHYLRNINFYSQQSGSAIVARLADIFGVEVFLDGFNRTVEYTPQSDIYYLASFTDSGYTETEGCNVEVVIDEKEEKFLDLDSTQTLTSTQKENIKAKIGTDTTVTESSSNLVTSGAVFNAVKQVSTIINGENIPAETLWSSPGYSSASFKYVSNPCVEGTACTAKLYSTGSWTRLGFSKTNSGEWGTSDVLIIDAVKANKDTQFIAPSQTTYPYIIYFLGSSNCSIQIEKNAITEEGLKDKVDNLIDDVGNLSALETTDKTSLVAAINETLSKGSSVAPVNIFGDILPASFKAKMYSNDDILIACQGDSIMGLIENCDANTDAAHDCPGGQYKHFVMQTQKTVCKVKPFYNRLDSQRNNADYFTKTGTWEQADNTTFSPSGNPAILDNMAEHSVACLTYRSNSNNAAVSFAFDADTYDKCNIIFTKNIYAAPAIIEITEGNGKMLVSEDRINWVEANGFTHSQATEYYYPLGRGDAFCERHRRLWMKKAAGVTGTVNITYRRNDSESTYFYCWGTEMYKGRGIFFDNIGRGGRNIGLLGSNISDIFDRNPDLAIVECPLANDLSVASNTTYDILISKYQNYFMDNGTNDTFSYRKRSNDYANFPLMVVLSHIRSVAFDGDAAVLEGSTYQKITTDPAYDIYKRVLGWLHTNLDSYQNVCLVDVLDQYLAQAKVEFGTIQAGLTGGKLTSDGIHLNQKGSDLYVDYLAPIFQI